MRHIFAAALILLAAAFALPVITTPVAAAIITWDGNGVMPPDGDFRVADNWNPDQVPGASDTALFSLAETYAVTFPSSMLGPAASDVLSVTAGDVTFSRALIGGDDIYNLTTNAEIVGGNLTLGDFMIVPNPLSLNVGDDLLVHGGSTLHVRFGSDVTVTQQVTIGEAPLGGSGTIRVSGIGSTLDATGTIRIGSSGTSSLIIENGGVVSGASGIISYDDILFGLGTTGTVTVNGPGSSWINEGVLVLALEDDGNGTLNIENGGAVSNTTSFIAQATDSIGAVIVDDVGSTWTNTIALFVGIGGVATLDVLNGGFVSSLDTFIASGTSPTGTVTVDGVGSTWMNSGDVFVAGLQSAASGNPGTLNVQNNGLVQVDGLLKIWDSGTVKLDGGSLTVNAGLDNSTGGTLNFRDGMLTVTGGAFAPNAGGATDDYVIDGPTAAELPHLELGAGATANIGDALFVGEVNRGELTVTGGGTVSNVTGFIGSSSGGIGIATIDGAGSTSMNSSGLVVGVFGNGTLNVQNGGTVSSFVGTIGLHAGSTGTATVVDAGSIWTNSGGLRVGGSGNGTLNITGGGAVTNTEGFIGDFTGSTGTANVDGAGSTWTNSSALIVGDLGNGTLNITGGGAVSSENGRIGDSSFSTGTATVDGDDGLGNPSTWTNSSALIVGRIGDGTLNITGGGAVFSDVGIIGDDLGSTGTANVDGMGSTWTNTADLLVGDGGSGTLNITGGGAVTNLDGFIGDGLGSTGTANVAGLGSTWMNSVDLRVGNFGSGSLNILNEGVVSNGVGFIGDALGSIGTATVDGVNSTWTNTADLRVGNSGNGTLNIQNGGVVSSVGGVIGNFASSNSTANIDGIDSTWTNSAGLAVGDNGSGSLNILNGGTVSNTLGRIGVSSGSTGTVTVDGPGSTWMNTETLTVGFEGDGTLTITGGGAVSNTFGFMGIITGSTGTATVDGPGSTWTISSGLNIGNGGNGALNITGGGTVSSGSSSIFNSTSTATVEDVGSTWTNSNVLNVNGTLSIQSGGTVTNIGGNVGSGASSTGTVTVDGPGSIWTTTGQLLVAGAGTGSLTITNNATVTSGMAVIGNSTGGMGNFTVTNGLFDNTFSMFVGGSAVAAGGQGTLTVEAQGLVDVGFTLTVWGPGTVQLNGGTIQVLDVVMNGGTFDFNSGMLNYTQDLAAAPGDELGEVLGPARTIGAGQILKVDGNMTVAPLTTVTLTGGGTLDTGGLTHEGDLLASAGSNQVFGPVNLIGGGRVEANGGNLQFNGPVDHNGAEIQVTGVNQIVFVDNVTGVGDFTGDGLVRFEAGYFAGNSPAEINFGGDIEFGPSSNVEFELGGTNTGPASDFDRLLVAGAATLDGVLGLSLINNFRQSISRNDTFVLMDTGGGISGNWANVLNGQRIGLTSGTGDFLVSYGAGSALDPTQLVLSDFLLPLFTATLSGSGDWTTANWIFEPATPVPPDFPNNDFDFTYHAIVGGGTVTLDQPITITISALTFTNGTIAATVGNDLTVRGPFDWSGGALSGTGSMLATGGLALSGDLEIRDGYTLENTGTATHTGGASVDDGRIIFRDDSTLRNTGTYNADTSGGTVLLDRGIGNNTFDNDGTFNQLGSGTTTIDIAFDNSGTVHVQAGRLEITRGFTNTGVLDIEFGSVLELAGGASNLNAGSSITGSGTLEFSGGTLNVNVAIIVASAFSQTGGTLSGSNTLTLNGLDTWSGGTRGGIGTTVAIGGLALSGDLEIRDGHTLENAGTATHTGGAFSDGRIVFLSSSTLRNTGTYNTDTSGGTVLLDRVSGNNTFDNDGTFNQLGSGTTTIDIGFDNSGTVHVQAGKAAFTRGYTQTAGTIRVASGAEFEATSTLDIQGGRIEGEGLIDANVNLAGTIAPGLSAGQLSVEGNLNFTGAAIYESELDGGGFFDSVAVTGLATLDGTLDVALINAFFPTPGETFEIMTFASRSGEFSSVTGDVGLLDTTTFLLPLYSSTNLLLFTAIPGDGNLDGAVTAADYTTWANGFGPGTAFTDGDYNGDGATTAADYTLWANNFGLSVAAPSSAPAAVPEPSTWVLFLIAASGLIAARRWF